MANTATSSTTAAGTPNSAGDDGPFTGGCACHQRETGSAFALNAMYEAPLVGLSTAVQPELVETSTASGNPQTIARCPACRVAVWSSYGTHGGDRVRIIRVGTLDNPDLFPPEMHIYTSTKQPWLNLSGDVPFVPEFYHLPDVWPKERLERLQRALGTSVGVGE
ncbi:hypothetical protein JX265_008036 [Neoarthrinium moseri]|uniref:CENP-V/GFA domain-containing protein n=1 Tax=Neoarthrinium moseri TaxID=1658444 RepID=A0A9P9WJ17_9PEZI|nr:hypothetical protein JX266_004648 [Neoarthrinium moseri]KAI1865713.1 hypothetical protein JX265_008036 [Neoarthrinium moseri]